MLQVSSIFLGEIQNAAEQRLRNVIMLSYVQGVLDHNNTNQRMLLSYAIAIEYLNLISECLTGTYFPFIYIVPRVLLEFHLDNRSLCGETWSFKTDI